LDELEEQVAKRVEAQLQSDEGNVSTAEEKSKEINTDVTRTSSDISFEKITANTPWMNFLSYLPWLKSSATTTGIFYSSFIFFITFKELINKMDDKKLIELVSVLSKVVDGKIVISLQNVTFIFSLFKQACGSSSRKG
jgi:hypothetical protein